MTDDYSFAEGIAFVVEGDTEFYFYQEYLAQMCKRSSYEVSKLPDFGKDAGYAVHVNGSFKVVLFHNRGSNSQLVTSESWLDNTCFGAFPVMQWTTFLCYDTDEDITRISKTSNEDWMLLRDSVASKGCSIIDLAADMDIEDVMLADYEGILRFLGLPCGTLPTGTKGKSKMKSLFKMVAINKPYHEGYRAIPLIKSLDMELIANKSPLDIKRVDEVILR